MQQNNKTPGRRRRSTKPASGQKNYASENDVHSDMPFAPDFPATPMKSNSESPAPGSLPANSKSNRRNNKGRPKNVSTSPGPAKPGRRTPPLSAMSKGPTATAFAGATFHASPAPSSLPIPSFFAKSMSDTPSVKVPIKELSPPASDTDSASPPRAAPITEVAREESPLDFFFRADRAEKEKARRASSANGVAPAGPFSPPSEPPASAPPARLMGFSPHGIQPRRMPHPLMQRHSDSDGLFGPELNGSAERTLGPAFSTPYHERIKAAYAGQRNIPQRSPRNVQVSHELAPTPPPSSQDKTEALKKYLFGGQLSAQSPNSLPAITQSRATTSTIPVQQAGLDFSHQAPPPTVARVAGSDRSTDVTAMENDLRRILKLESPHSSSSPSTMAKSQSS